MKLTEEQADELMYSKGYRFKLTATNNEIEPLYVKTLLAVTRMIVEWNKIKFSVTSLQDTACPA